MAQEDLSSGNYMLPYCKKLIDGTPGGAMTGFCAGAIEMVAYLGPVLKDGDRFCLPATARGPKQQRIVLLYLERNPHSTMFACRLNSGIGHAFLLLDDGRVLDNRFDEVMQYGEVGCAD